MSTNHRRSNAMVGSSQPRAIDTPNADARQATSSTSSLESLPAEIQLLMLKLLPDLTTFGNLVRASPTHYQLYTSDREGFMTAVTLNQLASRGIDVLGKADYWEVCMGRGASEDELRTAIEACRACPLKPEMAYVRLPGLERVRRERASNDKGSIKLSSRQCASLLTMQAVQIWSFAEVDGQKDSSQCVRTNSGAQNPHFDIANKGTCFLDNAHHYCVFSEEGSPPQAIPQELLVKMQWAWRTTVDRFVELNLPSNKAWRSSAYL